MARAVPTFDCPHCGAPVRRGARVCRECGSDAGTGWGPDAETGGLDAPSGYGADDFDYDAFLAEEGLDGRRGGGRRVRRERFVRVVLIVLCALLVLWAIVR